jgi:glycosyltransferase involved in cell wall biosynthesis
MPEDKQFSVIIACKQINADTQKCVDECLRQKPEKEIFVIDDGVLPGLPSEKRNFAVSQACGKYLAFIDSDAYPPPDWLETAQVHLKSYDAVCGAGILPPHSSLREQASDLVFQMLPYGYRVKRSKARIVPEFPTFNLIVKKDLAGDFPPILTGEDSVFCRRLPCAIYYTPDLFVYHKRRPLFTPFFRQVATYGFHRGYLIGLACAGWIGGVCAYVKNFLKGLISWYR